MPTFRNLHDYCPSLGHTTPQMGRPRRFAKMTIACREMKERPPVSSAYRALSDSVTDTSISKAICISHHVFIYKAGTGQTESDGPDLQIS